MENAVLFLEVFEDGALFPVHPSCNRNEQDVPLVEVHFGDRTLRDSGVGAGRRTTARSMTTGGMRRISVGRTKTPYVIWEM